MTQNDPTSWRYRWESYALATRGLWRRFPESLECGLTLVRPASPARLRHRWRSSFRQLLKFLLSSQPPGVYLPQCDFILCYHSVSDNVKAPMLELASRLSAEGARCLIRSYEGTWLWEKSGRTDLSERYRSLEAHPAGFIEALGLLSRAVAVSVALFVTCFPRRKALKGLFHDPFSVVCELARSAHRLRLAKLVCEKLEPRAVCLTHERFSPGADLALAGQVRSILYLHGNPTTFEAPVISEEVMVWNERAGEWLGLFFDPNRPAPRLHVCGNSELDLVLSRKARPADGSQPPTLLFLSQCVDRDSPELWKGSAEALQWLKSAAEHRPDWRFLIKERNYDDGIARLAVHCGLDRLSNVGFAPKGDSFVDLIARPEIRAVAAFSSSGLFVAAGAGKHALRFVVTPEETVSVIDDVTVRVYDPRELDGLLQDATHAPFAFEPELFPYRGRALDRIQEVLCHRDPTELDKP